MNKQDLRTEKIIDYFGEEYIINYLVKFFREININNLTKEQKQKIITGLENKIPKAPIKSVFGRDFKPIGDLNE